MRGDRQSGEIGPAPCTRIKETAGPWTPALVEARLREAVRVRTRPPTSTAIPGGASTTIDTESSPAARSMGIMGGIGPVPLADGDDGDVIAKAVEALSWLRWLDVDDAGIVLARLEGASWKAVCWRFGISRPTADRRLRYALAIIAWRLNGNEAYRRPPSLRALLGMRRAA